MANRLSNVANGFDSEYFKNRAFLKKIENSNLINTFHLKNSKDLNGDGYVLSIMFVDFLRHST